MQFLKPCCQLLSEKNLTIAFAESATAGRVCADFALIPGIGSALIGGVVCYDQSVKENLLQVPKAILNQYSAESRQASQAIAAGLRNVMPADIAVGVTGLTAPGGSYGPGKPIGSMFICVNIKGEDHFHEDVFYGAPEEIIEQTVTAVAKLLADKLSTFEV